MFCQGATKLISVQTQSSPVPLRLSKETLPHLLAGLSFILLFWEPLITLGRDWWHDPEAGHGLLLGPLTIYLCWRSGKAANAKAQPGLALAMLVCAILFRYMSGLAAELFTMRFSMIFAMSALVVFYGGINQLRHWWLPALLLMLSVPVPAVILNSIAFPLQLKASQMGATLLEWRHVPVALAGNVIHLPERSLFVTEACSGLRSLTALISLGVLIGGLWLRYPVTRIVLVFLAVPVAMVLNGIRVFLTGFFVHFVDPAIGDGFMHYTEGWVVFVVAFAILGAIAWVLTAAERSWHKRRAS